MITCLLFEADKPQTAKQCDIKLDITGWVGQGEALVRFETDKRLNNAVLYIPALLFHESGSRASLLPISCTLEWLKNGTAVKTDELQLTRANWRDPDMERSKLSISRVKSTIEPAVIAQNGALSSNDVLLSIGNLESGLELTVQFNFVLQFEPIAISDPETIKCIFAALLPSNKVTMTVNMAAVSDVASVDLLDKHQPSSHPPSSLQVSIDSTNVTATVTGLNCSTPLGIIVSLNPAPESSPLKSSCHSLHLLESPLDVNTPLKETSSKKLHGVQMLSSLPHQNAARNDWKKLSPSEILFLVDCSGSMSGKRIQSASEALLLAVKSLPPGCLFNIVAFGSKYRILFQTTSMEVTTKYVEKAVQFANQLQACLGGTELLTPLRWLLKKPLQNGLRRELFIITDGGVPNISSVLHSVRKYSCSTRCHTFALGPEICSEVMASIACETGGRYVIVDEETRLQAKIMEVLKSCLQPPITDLTLNWPAPSGYISEKPNHVAPASIRYSGAAQTFFTTLTKAPHFHKNGSNPLITPPIITGFLMGERVQGTAELHYENNPPFSEMGQTLLRNAAWNKMCSLNNKLLNPHKKKNSSEGCEDGEAPPTKRPRLNGSHDSSSNNSDVVEELVSISLSSGVPFHPYTHFESSCQNDDGQQRVCQLLSWNGPLKTQTQKKEPTLTTSPFSIEVPVRKRARNHHHHHNHGSNSSASLSLPSVSLSSIAKRTASSLTSAFKSAMSIATFGLVNMESNDTSLDEEGGERIEDQDYYQNKEERIHWDEHHRLVLPKIYYQIHSNTETGSSNSNHSDSRSHQTLSRARMECSSCDVSDRHSTVEQQSVECGRFNEAGGLKNSEESSDDSGSEDKLLSDAAVMEVDQSNSSTRNSVDCSDEDHLATTTDLYPSSGCAPLRPDFIALVQLQLTSGGWPLIPAISIATGVPMSKILNLPTKNGYNDTKTESSSSSAGQAEAGHVWASVLAVVCLRVHFLHLKMEWDLLSMKGEAWLREREDSIPLSLMDAREMAAEIIPKTV